MSSILTGWWSWLVAMWAGALVLLAVTAPFGGDLFAGVIFALVMLVMAGVVLRALVIRHRAPRAAAWLLVLGVGLPGIGFFWLLFIPTALAVFILVSGVVTGEISFTAARASAHRA